MSAQNGRPYRAQAYGIVAAALGFTPSPAQETTAEALDLAPDTLLEILQPGAEGLFAPLFADEIAAP